MFLTKTNLLKTRKIICNLWDKVLASVFAPSGALGTYLEAGWDEQVFWSWVSLGPRLFPTGKQPSGSRLLTGGGACGRETGALNRLRGSEGESQPRLARVSEPRTWVGGGTLHRQLGPQKRSRLSFRDKDRCGMDHL